jgi:hypothetical protein
VPTVLRGWRFGWRLAVHALLAEGSAVRRRASLIAVSLDKTRKLQKLRE